MLAISNTMEPTLKPWHHIIYHLSYIIYYKPHISINIYHISRQTVKELLQRIPPRLAGAMRSMVGRVATLSMQTVRRLVATWGRLVGIEASF